MKGHDTCKCGASKLIDSKHCSKCHTELIRRNRAATFGKGHTDKLLPGVRRVIVAAYLAADVYGRAKLAALNKDIDFSAGAGLDDDAIRMRRGAGRHSRDMLEKLGIEEDVDFVVVSGVVFINRSTSERVRLSSAAKRMMSRIGSDPTAKYYDCQYLGVSPNGKWQFNVVK